MDAEGVVWDLNNQLDLIAAVLCYTWYAIKMLGKNLLEET